MPKKNRDEWTPLYTAEFLLDPKVCLLPLAAQGLLVRCWCLIHQNGSLPGDPATAARLLGVDPRTFRSLWPQVVVFLCPHPEIAGDWTSNRLRIEVETAAILRERARLGASITNSKRWSGGSHSDSPSDRYTVSVSSTSPGKEESTKEKKEGSAEREPEPLLLGSSVPGGSKVEQGARRGRMGGKLVELSNLRPENRAHFDRVDAAWLPRSDGRPSRGNKAAAEALFQTIVDVGVLDGQKVTAEELATCATEVYLKQHPNAIAGVVMMLKTFYALDTGEWKNCLRILREERFSGKAGVQHGA